MFLVEKYFVETPCTMIIIITEMKRVRVKVRSRAEKNQKKVATYVKKFLQLHIDL